MTSKKQKIIRPDYYYGCYTEGVDPEVTCWHCGKTFLCDAMDAICRLCHAPFDKSRCKEFNFVPNNTIENMPKVVKSRPKVVWEDIVKYTDECDELCPAITLLKQAEQSGKVCLNPPNKNEVWRLVEANIHSQSPVDTITDAIVNRLKEGT